MIYFYLFLYIKLVGAFFVHLQKTASAPVQVCRFFDLDSQGQGHQFQIHLGHV